ncbi:MAG: DUF502 domain-containing protein [Nitrospina sp.]|nr:MAG: DUF502 domain-containing protein [Nitrospina sp.]TDJ57908.1 MAG: DUF502 domain-containing protein [Nitrospina sp.]
MFSNLKRRLRNIFITGILITVPVAFTLFILNFLFKLLDNLVVPWFIKTLIRIGTPIPEDFRLPGLGLILIVLLIFVIGVLTQSFLGGKLVQLGEMIVDRIPVVRSIYTGAKQVVTTIAKADTKAFRKVVLVEFPRKGIYSLGFITGYTEGEVQELTNAKLVNVFVPTTPNPTSGFLVFVANEEIIELTMTIEDGIKFIISVGIVTPEYHQGKILELKKDYQA